MSGGDVIIGVDVGGTFTDVFALDEAGGEVRVTKVPSTPGDQSRGFMDGIGQVAEGSGAVATVVHGTTVATNALLERRGAKTGIITTRGFRDVLEMRRRDRPTTWGLWGTFTPVVSRDNRLEVAERTLADGTVREAVDPGEVCAAARQLLENGCDAICVFFINGYANPQSEMTAVAAVRSLWPTSHVTAATEILPEIREFERCSTATLNAYLQPVVSSYLDRLEEGMRAQGSDAEILIVQSNGGIMTLGDGEAAAGAHRVVRTCRRCHRGGSHCPRGGISQRDHLRHGRHVVRRVADLGLVKARCRRRPRLISAWSSARR